MRDKKGVDLDGKRKEESLDGGEENQTIMWIYYEVFSIHCKVYRKLKLISKSV